MNQALNRLLQENKTAFYVFDIAKLKARIAHLQAALPPEVVLSESPAVASSGVSDGVLSAGVSLDGVCAGVLFVLLPQAVKDRIISAANSRLPNF